MNWGFEALALGHPNNLDHTVTDIDLPVGSEPGAHEVAKMLRGWFDTIIDSLSADALSVLRAQCLRAEQTAANAEIIATIDRRLARLRECRLPGS